MDYKKMKHKPIPKELRERVYEKYGIKISEWNKKFYFENVK